ncbi:MAG: PhzF family phenazine biosynthesis protein [Kordiimonadaceae bacterium]|nr:PhzF family phenazine biosynthesis protein [Kordiimonadaceae bacterium]
MYQIDAFTDTAFCGNPAAVCPLDDFLPDETLQAIAAENNLAETAYLVPMDGTEADYHLRWFTPTTEVTLCGHATLASAYVVLQHLRPELQTIRFATLSGILTVKKQGAKLEMSFPALPVTQIDIPAGLGDAMGAEPDAVFKGEEADRDLLLIYKDAAIIAGLCPDLAALRAFAPYGFIATAKGSEDEDFVSRCFFPNHGIDEDAVTGSAHCVSAPYWADVLGKNTLFARQISARGGELWLTVAGHGRVEMAGYAVEVMRGTLFL